MPESGSEAVWQTGITQRNAASLNWTERLRTAVGLRWRKARFWIGSIVIDCNDFPRMVAFWQEALRYVPREPPSEGWVLLKDPEGLGPNVGLNRSSEGPLDQYRLHLDLYSSDPEKEVERLVRLGATLRRSPEKGEDFVTLADPDGNLFDVINKKLWRPGQRT